MIVYVSALHEIKVSWKKEWCKKKEICDVKTKRTNNKVHEFEFKTSNKLHEFKVKLGDFLTINKEF